MSFRGLELQNKLLEGANLIIVNYEGRKGMKAEHHIVWVKTLKIRVFHLGFDKVSI